MPKGSKPGERRGGRQKGTPNKITQQAKEAIALAAEVLGGFRRLVEWAKEAPENERVFWASIYTKLVPLSVGGDPDNPIQITDARNKLAHFLSRQAAEGDTEQDTITTH
jgi:hypothetical protein